jgi:hypothetical protein
MMALPFLLFTLSFWLAYKGKRAMALFVFFLDLALVGFLWKFHMTSDLPLQF